MDVFSLIPPIKSSAMCFSSAFLTHLTTLLWRSVIDRKFVGNCSRCERVLVFDFDCSDNRILHQGENTSVYLLVLLSSMFWQPL
jgi:hypothetical protein